MSIDTTLGRAAARASQIAQATLQAIQQQIAALRRRYAEARAARQPFAVTTWSTA